MRCFPLAIYFTFGSVYMSMPLSHFVPAYPSPSPYPQVHSLVGLHLYSHGQVSFHPCSPLQDGAWGLGKGAGYGHVEQGLVMVDGRGTHDLVLVRSSKV